PYLIDQSHYILSRYIVQRTLIFLLEPLPQIMRCDEAGFAVAQAAAVFLLKLHERGMGQSNDHATSIHNELGIHRIAMPRGNRVPQVGKAAVINLVCQSRSNFELTDKIAHSPKIWNSRGCGHMLLVTVPFSITFPGRPAPVQRARTRWQPRQFPRQPKASCLHPAESFRERSGTAARLRADWSIPSGRCA